MRRVLAGFAIHAALAVGAAHAQQSEWIEPAGRYALGFEALGWTATPDVVQPPQVLAFVRNDSPRDDRMRICFVREDVVPHSTGGNQQSANQILERWDEARVAQVVGTPVSDVVHSSMSGVHVIDYRTTQNGLGAVVRFFMLEDAPAVDLITITCTAPSPLSEEESASMSAVMNSLRILQRAEP